MIRHAIALTALLGGLAAGTAAADFAKVTDEREFLRLVAENKLTRMGIEVTVTPSGEIRGSAFGSPVTGNWSWKGEYFCRDLAWGDKQFGYNCQEVARDGNALRFTSDRGAGRSAKLYLE